MSLALEQSTDAFAAVLGLRRGAGREREQPCADVSWEHGEPWPAADHVLFVAGQDDDGRALLARVACPGQPMRHGELNRTRSAMVDFLSTDQSENYGVMVSWCELLDEDVPLVGGARISGLRRVALIRAILRAARAVT